MFLYMLLLTHLHFSYFLSYNLLYSGCFYHMGLHFIHWSLLIDIFWYSHHFQFWCLKHCCMIVIVVAIYFLSLMSFRPNYSPNPVLNHYFFSIFIEFFICLFVFVFACFFFLFFDYLFFIYLWYDSITFFFTCILCFSSIFIFIWYLWWFLNYFLLLLL